MLLCYLWLATQLKGWTGEQAWRDRKQGDGKIWGRWSKAQRQWNLWPYGRQKGEVSRNGRLGSLPSLMKRRQNVFGNHCLHYCPQTLMPRGTICHKKPSSVLFAASDSAMVLHARTTWIWSKDEAKLVCKPSPSEIKTLLKPSEWV